MEIRIGVALQPICVSNRDTMQKTSALRIRLEPDMHREFIELCKHMDKPAAQVLREYIRQFISENKGESTPKIIKDD